jgi:hypothetical protein
MCQESGLRACRVRRWRAISLTSIAFAGIIVAVRFHALMQPVNQEWVARLEQLSKKFRDLGEKAQGFIAPGPSLRPPRWRPRRRRP